MYVKFPKDRAGYWSLREQTMSTSGKSIRFKNRVRSIEVTSRSAAKEADSKLSSAAAGAILGFLVAGPLGTVIGAGSGAGSARAAKSETFGVTIHFVDQGFLIGEVDEFELEKLRQNIVTEQGSQAASPSGSMADELAKLVKLRDAGALSAKEFSAAKTKLLK